ncbi:hypothetical protein, variant 5 [Fonticula alba]|uniref:Uncharacterized protein n=1 Tax=Fonticula alba TaxID=691883 RepID=A0A058ZHG4_FONAL|nr:hypothetical protein, variant 3 [Fonticula alba]XP_009492621.1 hypothetical protein, variant 4 [Fonticula alba]XP_009492622.1 hypothetical protein, variant 5 [Fonticula alba]KCV72921.1 hypothetical protein, variant 3 [Fonticula alba]KCV72922.1 hypothetical protein, variant 4 [Fonticula alba]KCV72923.1 hypothetical protein, variant 5 [Fonticula alba]|eukprot:XP_009492620.1 hypothetical protein, variant 3 [Fonticula alba]
MSEAVDGSLVESPAGMGIHSAAAAADKAAEVDIQRRKSKSSLAPSKSKRRRRSVRRPVGAAADDAPPVDSIPRPEDLVQSVESGSSMTGTTSDTESQAQDAKREARRRALLAQREADPEAFDRKQEERRQKIAAIRLERETNPEAYEARKAAHAQRKLEREERRRQREELLAKKRARDARRAEKLADPEGYEARRRERHTRRSSRDSQTPGSPALSASLSEETLPSARLGVHPFTDSEMATCPATAGPHAPGSETGPDAAPHLPYEPAVIPDNFIPTADILSLAKPVSRSPSVHSQVAAIDSPVNETDPALQSDQQQADGSEFIQVPVRRRPSSRRASVSVSTSEPEGVTAPPPTEPPPSLTEARQAAGDVVAAALLTAMDASSPRGLGDDPNHDGPQTPDSPSPVRPHQPGGPLVPGEETATGMVSPSSGHGGHPSPTSPTLPPLFYAEAGAATGGPAGGDGLVDPSIDMYAPSQPEQQPPFHEATVSDTESIAVAFTGRRSRWRLRVRSFWSFMTCTSPSHGGGGHEMGNVQQPAPQPPQHDGMAGPHDAAMAHDPHAVAGGMHHQHQHQYSGSPASVAGGPHDPAVAAFPGHHPAHMYDPSHHHQQHHAYHQSPAGFHHDAAAGQHGSSPAGPVTVEAAEAAQAAESHAPAAAVAATATTTAAAQAAGPAGGAVISPAKGTPSQPAKGPVSDSTGDPSIRRKGKGESILRPPTNFSHRPTMSTSSDGTGAPTMRPAPRVPLVKFNEVVAVRRTFSGREYDRKGDVTWRLTHEQAIQIREELNIFKREMEIHELSRQNTHFY